MAHTHPSIDVLWFSNNKTIIVIELATAVGFGTYEAVMKLSLRSLVCCMWVYSCIQSARRVGLLSSPLLSFDKHK